ncbi:MAG: type IV pilus assembly protein PilM [Planctomycetes bacterium]|nr:type IV pilus assembly protein PilM [Planctomycetota bacterium]
MALNWKKLLQIDHNEVFGLDIGTSSVKMVQLSKNNSHWTVSAAGIVDIIEAAENEKAHHEINTAKAIRDCLLATGIQTPFVVCSVCGPEVAVRRFKFPALANDEIAGATLMEAKQVCPFNVDEGVVDYQVVPSDDKNNIRGVMVAATNKIIDKKTRLVKNTSLSTVMMDVDGLALLNYFGGHNKFQKGQTTAILNVGNSFTNLVIMGDNGLPFVRDLSYAGQDIIKEIAKHGEYAIAETGYEKLDIKHKAPNPKLLEDACRKLVVGVTETLRYYTAQEQSAVIDEIVVCGGFALVEGFVEILNEQLPTAAVLWNPFDEMACDESAKQIDLAEILNENGPALAVAAGLAMRGI